MRAKTLAVVALITLAALCGLPPAPAGADTEAAPGPLTDVASVAAGGNHSCAVVSNQRARCWGDNEHGQLGDGTQDPRTRAVIVKNTAGTGPLRGVTAVTTGGNHTCALLASRRVACWGDNGEGQLGLGSTESERLLPTLVADENGLAPLEGVAQVSAGGAHACARLVNEQVRCWGNNDLDQLGKGTTGGSDLPVAVSVPGGGGPLPGVAQIDAGDAHTCARLFAGAAVCWGSNFRGTLGDGTADVRHLPVIVSAEDGTGVLVGVRRVSAGGTLTCAVLTDRTARCWGGGQYGQLGEGQIVDRFRPVAVLTRAGGPPLSGIGTVDTGYGHACARMTNTQVRCWGQNDEDELGNGVHEGPDIGFPRAVRAVSGTGVLTGVAQVQTNNTHTCVRLANSQARCWGWGEDGELGDGGVTSRPRPVVVRS